MAIAFLKGRQEIGKKLDRARNGEKKMKKEHDVLGYH